MAFAAWKLKVTRHEADPPVAVGSWAQTLEGAPHPFSPQRPSGGGNLATWRPGDRLLLPLVRSWWLLVSTRLRSLPGVSGQGQLERRRLKIAVKKFHSLWIKISLGG